MVDIMVLQEVHRRAASEATSGALPQSSGRPSPPESVLRKPFDRLSEVALTEEALPDSGAGLLLGDKELSLREHCAALACVCGVGKSFCSRVLKSDARQAAPEAAIDVHSPHGGTSHLAGSLRRTAAHCLVGCSGVHCRRWMTLGQALLWRRAYATRDLTSADRERGRRHGSRPRRQQPTADDLRPSRPPL